MDKEAIEKKTVHAEKHVGPKRHIPIKIKKRTLIASITGGLASIFGMIALFLTVAFPAVSLPITIAGGVASGVFGIISAIFWCATVLGIHKKEEAIESHLENITRNDTHPSEPLVNKAKVVSKNNNQKVKRDRMLSYRKWQTFATALSKSGNKMALNGRG